MPETEKSSSWSRMASVSRDALSRAPRQGRQGLAAVAAHWRWWLPRLLATGGTLLFFYAFYAPWLIFSGGSFSSSVNGDQLLPLVPYAFDQSQRLLGSSAGIRLVEAVLVALGLEVATLLWMRLSPLTARLARGLLLLWVLVTVLVILGTFGAFNSIVNRQNAQYAGGPNPRVLTWRPEPSLALVALALALAFIGWFLMRGEAHSMATRPRPSAQPRTPWQVLAALLFTAGIALWVFGFFAVPWATVNCTGLHISLNHFVSGSCAGLDAGDALVYSPRLGVKALDDSARQGSALTALYALLAGYAVLALVAAWRRVRTRAMLIWCGCWLVGITLLAGLAVRGVEPILAKDPALSSASIGEWVMGPGVGITFIGLLAAWFGLIFLWRATHHAAESRSMAEVAAH